MFHRQYGNNEVGYTTDKNIFNRFKYDESKFMYRRKGYELQKRFQDKDSFGLRFNSFGIF